MTDERVTRDVRLREEGREALRDWWDSEREADTAGTMLANLDAAVERIVAARVGEVVERVEADVVHEALKYAVLRSTTRGPVVKSITVAQLPDIIRAALNQDATP